jgi:hypothetical protein
MVLIYPKTSRKIRFIVALPSVDDVVAISSEDGVFTAKVAYLVVAGPT